MFSTSTWTALTHLGAAAAILPMVPAIGLGLWLEGRRRAATAWLAALGTGILLVLVSKFAFIGWGLGIARLDFTGVSGHSFLAAAILPVGFAWLPPGRRPAAWATLLGVGLAVLVGGSRVVLNAHSWSEVAAGWGLGALVSGTALWQMGRAKPRRPLPHHLRGFIAAAVGLALALSPTVAVKLPMHALEVRLALALSGREHPFSRHDLHRQGG